MKHNIYIQEIEKLNEEISVYKLINRHFKWNWWIVIILPILMSILSYAFFWYTKYYFLIIFVVLSVISFIPVVRFMDKKRENIIRQKYPYALKEEKFVYNRVIPEIQKREFIKLINNPKVLTKDNISFIIENLKSKKDENKYPYTITFNVVILFFSMTFVLLSRYLEFVESYETFLKEVGAIMGISLLFSIIIIYTDKFILKEFTLNKSKKQNRLIRTLENIYLDIPNKVDLRQ